MNVLAVYNIKGGVGKTSTAVNLGWLAAREGLRTLLWDLDPQAAATYCFRVQPRSEGSGRKLIQGRLDLSELIRGTDLEGLDLLPADFSDRKMDIALDAEAAPRKRLARLLQPLSDEYDLLILDCAPSISRLSESVFVAADLLLVPTIPTPLALRTLDQLEKHLAKKKRRPRVRPFFCMVDRRKSLHRETCESRQASRMLKTSIPYSTHIEQMSARRAAVHAFAPWSPAAQAYEGLWREVSGLLGDGSS